MSQKCCSKEGFVAVLKLNNFHNQKLRNLLVVNFSDNLSMLNRQRVLA